MRTSEHLIVGFNFKFGHAQSFALKIDTARGNNQIKSRS